MVAEAAPSPVFGSFPLLPSHICPRQANMGHPRYSLFPKSVLKSRIWTDYEHCVSCTTTSPRLGTSRLSASSVLRSVQKQPQSVRIYFLHENFTDAAA